MPVTVGLDHKVVHQIRHKQPYNLPRREAIAHHNDDFSIEEAIVSVIQDTTTMSITSHASHIASSIQKPRYALYYDKANNETDFFRDVRLQTHDAIKDWRTARLDAAIAKYNMDYAEDYSDELAAEAEYGVRHMQRELLWLKKRFAEKRLSKHKDTAKKLKAKRIRREEKGKSLARIQRLAAQMDRSGGAARTTVRKTPRRLN